MSELAARNLGFAFCIFPSFEPQRKKARETGKHVTPHAWVCHTRHGGASVTMSGNLFKITPKFAKVSSRTHYVGTR